MRVKFNQNSIDYLDNNFKNQLRLEDFFDKNNTFLNENKDFYLEIGPGKGNFIIELAKKNLDKNFIVVELNKTIAGYCLKKIDESKLSNIKLLAIDFYKMVEVIKPDFFSGIFLNFSDPWPKKRHEKRRLTSDDFFIAYNKILKLNHCIYFKSDNDDFYEYSYKQAKLFNFEIIYNNINYKDDDNFDAFTEYETKFINKGIKIKRFICKKITEDLKVLSKLEEKYFKEITQLFGPSGSENEVRDYLKNEFNKLGFEIIKDNLGSIFAYKKSNSMNPKKVMICAHMDEVGFYVGNILNNGMIKPLSVGGFNYNSLQAQRVILLNNKNEKINGTIDTTPPHLLGNNNGIVNNDNLLMDFGFDSNKDANEFGVTIGCPIICKGDFEYSYDKKSIISKAIDDRYGIILGLIILHELKNLDLPYDLYVGGTVQEEVGCRGANTATYTIKPDLAIVLDCSPARDSLGRNGQLGILGEGVLIRHFDRSYIANRKLLNMQIDACIKTNSKYQYFDSPGGTDAGVIHKSLDGVLTLTHCICARSIHTSSSIMRISDYIDAKNSLLYLLKNLTSESIEGLNE